MTEDRSYEVAIEHLNELQSNAVTLSKSIEANDRHRERNLTDTVHCCERVGITSAAFNSLKFIHVSGTKGKGSTCAFMEAILRQHGLKTGFFSSPHLVEVCERVRINGVPISRPLFAQHFWEVYEKLHATIDIHVCFLYYR